MYNIIYIYMVSVGMTSIEYVNGGGLYNLVRACISSIPS
jgi:hypothetical protein